MRIQWTSQAEWHLKEIYDYYASEASPRIARKVVHKILVRVKILENNPLIGSVEEFLIDDPEEFRFLVESNYKIIYWIKDEVVTIASVFDCRRNPNRMGDTVRS
jgi:plasmid stabilization system protein ParE